VIETTVVGVLALVGFLYVLAPLRGGAVADSGTDGIVEDAVARKTGALDALVDLEDERAIGKLSTEDFEVLRDEYEIEAVQAIDDLDVLGRSDADLEAEIAAMRERLTCPSCGALRAQGEPCPRCGS
jgi:hypothetical protein